MKTITYEGVQHGDWVRCVLCGAQMLLPCGADKCPECGENGTLRWVDEERQEIDAKGLDCLYERECDALFDIDGRGNTERLVTRNPKLRNLLENGEYIPSLGQLNLMAHYMNELNKAFAYVSASPLSTTWYWSSTESSQAVAWYVVFSSGLTGTGNKHIGDMVRAVIDF